jgi:predicted transcriptional regulator
MSIESRKISLAQQLFAIQQEAILDKIEAILKGEFSVLTNQQKSAIDKGLNALENGDKIPHNQVIAETKERYPNLFK